MSKETPVWDEDLELFILGRLVPSEVSGDSSISKNDAEKFVKQMAELSRQQVRPPGEERRNEPRFRLQVAASLKALSPPSAIRSEVRIIDVAQGGLKLRVPEFLHPGTVIQIRLKRTIAMAEVRYCHPEGSEFDVGVKLQDVFPRA
jgi:hypothetical protein